MRVGAWEVESSAPPHKIAEALGAFADPHTGTSEMLTSEFDVRNGQEQEALASLLFSFVGVHGALLAFLALCGIPQPSIAVAIGLLSIKLGVAATVVVSVVWDFVCVCACWHSHLHGCLQAWRRLWLRDGPWSVCPLAPLRMPVRVSKRR